MKTFKTIVTAIIFITLFLGCNNKAFSQLFYDSFESQNMSTTNSDGFFWGGNNRTSVVTQHATDGPVAVYNNGSIYNIAPSVMNDGTVRDWTAFDGDYSLRFRYPAGENWAEQRYELGVGYPEVWVSYWMRVPNNYYRGSGNNNKWFNIQMGTMSQYQDPTVSRIEMQDWSNNNGGMDINIQFRNGSDQLFNNSPSYPDFITPDDAGRWMHLIYHMKASQTNTSTDGILRMYRKWESDTNYTLINELVNLNVGIGAGSVSSGLLGWAGGYIMGYSNAPYTNDTEWLLDKFTVSETSLLDSSLSTNEETFNNTISITPNPTANIFTIDLGNEILEKVIIYNELGQKIKELPIAIGTNEVNISNLSNGIYVVKITSQNGKTSTKKIIKN